MSRTPDEARPGRVVSSHGRDAVVEDRDGHSVHCRMRGRRVSVVCGDEVLWLPAETEGGDGLVVERLPRRTELSRINLRGEPEPVAANLTQLVAVLAPLPEPDLGLCDRYLAAAAWAGLKACIVANKSDLPGAREALEPAISGYAGIGYPVVWTTKREPDGAASLAALLAGETSVLVGQSGVGKSSLTNLLVPGVSAYVRQVSEATRSGRHTTTTSSLYRLPSGGELIDSPGVRDYAPPLPAPREVSGGFREIETAAGGCRFADCRHAGEPGCAVQAEVQAGRIGARRQASYRQLLRLAEEFARPGARFRK